MSKNIWRFLLAISGFAAALPSLANNAASDLAGEWRYTENQCTDYFFFSENHFKSISNKETIEANVSILPLPDSSVTQLQVNREVTYDSLGPDCAGEDKNDAGKKDTRYIKFNNAKDQYAVCRDQQGKQCWGPILKAQ